MSSVSTTNISGTDPGTDHDFGRPSGTGVFLYRYPGTSYLATITLSLRDKIHSSAEALLKLTLIRTRSRAIRGSSSDDRVGSSAPDGRCAPARPALHVSTRLLVRRGISAGRDRSNIEELRLFRYTFVFCSVQSAARP